VVSGWGGWKFRAGGAVIELAKQERIAGMRAEAVPWRCHRSLIADALVGRGIEVRGAHSAADCARVYLPYVGGGPRVTELDRGRGTIATKDNRRQKIRCGEGFQSFPLC
jgi:hypothetical protein